MISKKDLGQKIREARKEAKLSQLELGVALKVSDKTISGYESGRISPPIDKLQKISELLKKPISFFLGIDLEDYSIQSRIKSVENVLKDLREELKAIRIYANNFSKNKDAR